MVPFFESDSWSVVGCSGLTVRDRASLLEEVRTVPVHAADDVCGVAGAAFGARLIR
jgi:hypothetical protein